MDHKLEKFLTIVEHGSFTQAAQTLHVSQPALTVAINELEKDLGTKLLDRKRGSFGLTESGHIVYDAALRMRSESHAMRQLLAEHSSHGRVVARVGMLDTVANLLFSSENIESELLSRVEVKVDNSTRLVDDLKFGRLDMAVITVQTLQIPDMLETLPLGDEKFVFVGRSEVIMRTEHCQITNWLAFNQASNTYARFVAEFERSGIVATPIFYSTSMDILKTMALQGKGVALLPLHFCQEEIGAGGLVCLDLPVFTRPLVIVRPKKQSQTVVTRNIADKLSELFTNR